MSHPPHLQQQQNIAAPLSGDPASQLSSETAISDPVVVPNSVGLHARPAASLVNAAKAYSSEIRLRRGNRDVNAKSLVSIMSLGVKQGDSVLLSAIGPDAREAVQKLAELIATGCGEGEAESTLPPMPSAIPAEKNIALSCALNGIPSAPGMAVGVIVQVRQEEIVVKERGEDPLLERQQLDEALREAAIQLEALHATIADPDKAAIFAAHEELLSDPELLDLVVSGISHGQSAAYAWQAACKAYANQLAALKDEVLAGRANDIRDVSRRVLKLLAGVTEEVPALPDNAILIAEDMTPSETAHLDRDKVLGFCTTGGGATSHVAILARSLGLPAICGIEERALRVENGTPAILDGYSGTLSLNPPPLAIAKARSQQARVLRQHANAMEHAQEHASTLDDQRIEVVANIGSVTEAFDAIAQGGEGVGLLRTEFLYLERTTPPSEAEQAANYCAIAKTLGPKNILVLRTLDVGGDKPLAYLPLPAEENPYLGIRGIRLLAVEPEILRTQIRAALQAASFTRLHLMFPMVATLEELREARKLVEEEKKQLGSHMPVNVGLMIEVPSAALMAEKFAKEADFFSIGTNDLTQYTLAMDRGHPKLAASADAFHPSVLQLIAITTAGAHKHGKWVGICGGMASDPLAVPLLIGLGVDELSVSIPSIATTKALIRKLSKAECEKLARHALGMETASEVRELFNGFLAHKS
ncbi:phosphocarrier protein FPr [Formivibrio citricus]|uniref:phosphoenolpyruvate--protein phosphotransferase n=1 Tax=Formivibrio citricus TaxID=83765 RepID=A0A1I5AK03_9NEIS|nr:phosphoenolpyruvate--protein phosphotransferase [Formivibrio citricus]SFN62758.1 phosphocarrier protein FPr [Formivibrio citricus]